MLWTQSIPSKGQFAWISEITTTLGQAIQVRVHRFAIRQDPNGWYLSCLDLGIEHYRLNSGQDFEEGTTGELALRYCAVIAHDRADALTRAYLRQS